jgi:hypothetical protein
VRKRAYAAKNTAAWVKVCSVLELDSEGKVKSKPGVNTMNNTTGTNKLVSSLVFIVILYNYII